MGNKDSKSKGDYGALHLELNKSTYTAGETIDGKVHLQLDKKFPGKVIYLEIRGEEKTKWKTGEHKHQGKHEIMVSKTAIQAFPSGQASVGQYSFPFTFQLPKWLPSSMMYFGPKKSAVIVRYKITVRFEECADSSQTTIKPLYNYEFP